MGKLHTIRRAVERDPEKWFNKHRVMSAVWYRGQWVPRERWWFDQRSYQNFVRKVLTELGYDVSDRR